MQQSRVSECVRVHGSKKGRREVTRGGPIDPMGDRPNKPGEETKPAISAAGAAVHDGFDLIGVETVGGV